MELIIEHTTKYEYKDPVSGLIQTTKLHPSEYNGLKILEWNVHNDSAKKSKIYHDKFLIFLLSRYGHSTLKF